MMFMPARQLSRTRHTVRQMGIFGPHESLFEFDFWATQRHFWRGILAITFEVYMRNSTSALVRSKIFKLLERSPRLQKLGLLVSHSA